METASSLLLLESAFPGRQLELTMSRQNGMHRQIALSLLIGLLIDAPLVLAQQQEPPQPAPAPSNPQTTGQSKTLMNCRRSQPARSSDWQLPAFLIGALIRSTAFSQLSHKQRMIQRLGDRDGTPTANVMEPRLQTIASGPT